MKPFKNVPLGEVREALKSFPKDKYIDVSCRVGDFDGVIIVDWTNSLLCL